MKGHFFCSFFVIILQTFTDFDNRRHSTVSGFDFILEFLSERTQTPQSTWQRSLTVCWWSFNWKSSKEMSSVRMLPNLHKCSSVWLSHCSNRNNSLCRSRESGETNGRSRVSHVAFTLKKTIEVFVEIVDEARLEKRPLSIDSTDLLADVELQVRKTFD